MNEILMGAVSAALLKVVLPAVLSLIGGYVLILVKRLAARAGLQLTAEQETRVKEVIQGAIRGVEERSRTQRMDPQEKLDLAIRSVDKALPKMPVLEVERRIHEELPVVRKELAGNAVLPLGPRDTTVPSSARR